MRVKLTNESIDKVCKSLEEFFTSKGIDRREVIKTRLMAEEALLTYKDNFGENVETEISFYERLHKASVQINVFCKKMDPFSASDDGVMKSLVGTITDSNHAWKYIRGNYSWIFSGEDRNEIVFTHKKTPKLNSATVLLISILVATIVGLICKNILTAETIAIISSDYIKPIADAFTGLLGVMAIILIFMSVPLCMAAYGSTVSFQNDARKLIVAFSKIVLIFTLITAIIGFISFSVSSVGEGASSFIKPILDVVLDFVPVNLIEPFLTFNCMQVMIIGMAFGAAFIVMGEKAKGLVSAFDQVNYVAVVVNAYLTKFVPFYVALMVFDMVMGNVEIAKALFWVIAVTVIVCLLGCLALALIVSKRYKVKLTTFVRKLLPSFLINLTTGSVGASFMVFFNELTEGCGVDVNYSGVSSNLGTVIFKPMYSVFLTTIGFIYAYIFGNLTIVTAVQIILLSIVLPAAIPNITGGAASVIVVLLTGLGLSADYAQSAITINSLLQFLIIPANIFILQCVIVLEAGKVGKLDVSVLTKESK